MNDNLQTYTFFGWLFGAIVLSAGILNFFLVHPVPGLVYLLVSLIYFPPVNEWIRTRFALIIPVAVKIILAVVIVWFTLGVSDLGDMIDG